MLWDLKFKNNNNCFYQMIDTHDLKVQSMEYTLNESVIMFN